MRRSRVLHLVRRTSAVLLFLAGSLFLYDNAFAALGVPSGITDEAKDIEGLYYFILALGTLVFLIVEGALIYAIFRYRRRDQDGLPVQTHGSNVLEFIWTGIPVLIVIAIFTYSFIVLQNVETTADDEDLTIEVVGFQYQWQFNYDLADLGVGGSDQEGQVSILGTPAAIPELHIPANERIEFKLVSNDVIHSFYIADFLYKLDVVPGRDNRFVVTARTPGVYDGQCAELCGVDHAMMRFTLVVEDRADFDAWIAEQSSSAAVRTP